MSIEFAKSLSGHDKNRIYYIWKKEERFAYLVDGKTHTLEKPKKKNETDAMIYRAVKAYDQSISRRQ